MFELFLVLSVLLVATFCLSFRTLQGLGVLFVAVAIILYLSYSSFRIGGVDTPAYREAFGTDGCAKFELGFALLCSLDSEVGLSVIFLLSSLLSFLMIARLAKSVRDFALAFAILLPFYMVVVDLGYVRQSIATSLVYLFFHSKFKGRLLLLVAAPLSHLSAIIVTGFLYFRRQRVISLPFLLMSLSIGATIFFIGVEFVKSFESQGLLALLSKPLGFSSIAQLCVFVLAVYYAAPMITKSRFFYFIMLTACFMGYFGHLLRVFFLLMPLIVTGVVHRLSGERFERRLMLLCLIFPILYVKLFEATKFSETGLDIQFSENSFFGL